jgi:hypothetical protein
VDWKNYKHPLVEHVYDVYIQYWGDRVYNVNFPEWATQQKQIVYSSSLDSCHIHEESVMNVSFLRKLVPLEKENL